MAMMTENNLNDSTNGSSTMYEDEADPIADYRQSLADLVMNSKPHILMLTMLAEDYKDSKAAEIVDCIEQRLFQVSNDKKLPTLYLIDSICKNMAVSSYVELFQAKIIKMFCHTFERSDEKVRLLLYKLRQTWNDIFAANVLYSLDLNVKKIDKAWPITNKPENGQSAQVKPGTKVPNVATSLMCKPNTKAAEITAQLLSKQNESLALHRQQIEMDLRKKIIMNAQRSGQLPLDHCEPVVNPVQNQSQKPQQPKALKETKRKTSISSSSQEQPPIKKGKKESSIKNNNSNKVNKNQSKKLKPITSLTPISPLTKNKKLGSGCGPANNNKRKAPLASPKIPKKASVLDTLPLNLPIAPDDVIPLGQSHRTAGPKWSKQDKFHRSTESSDSVKSRRSPFRHRSPSQSSAPQSSGTRNRSSPTKSFKNDSSSSVSNTINNKKLSTSSTIQTTIPEPNIFAQPEALYSFSSLDNNAGPKSTDSNWNHSSPAQQPAAASSFAMDRDYRHEFDTFVSEAKNKLNTGAISSADHELLVREAERHLFEMQANAPSPFGANSPFGTSVVPSHQSHVPTPLPPTSQQPLPAAVDRPVLVEPHGSIVLFINNELRRLYYVDTVTSIVLLKVHPDTIFDQLVSCDPALLEPKQVFFSGMTTTVYIDHGQPTEQSINLEFNSSVPCTFYLPGCSVPQQIMLGLPARELVINGRAHQAAFGGASVSIYFDCDRKYHTFQLSDSRPLLKFSGEFRCDLWLKLVNDARLKAGLPAMAPPPQQQQPHFSNYPPSAGPIPQVTHPFSSAVPNNNNPYPMSQQQHQLPYNQPPFSEVPQPHASIQPTTNLSYNIPAPPTSFDNSAPTPTKFPDLNSLLSKLTAVGLIGNKGASTSIKAEPDSQKTESEPVVIPKQYLPLEVSALKNSHQFVVDQLYSGVQCTNCSLRFSDATLKDGKGTKSRYSRHLDWHFRQNRRDKAKPGSNATGSSTVAHRRPWYYAIDLWILFKEVNDDIEEDSSEFFDSNSANSPGGTSTTVNNFDFSRFKDCISDFETFIEVISCDNNKIESAACGRNNSDQQQLKKKVCSVVAESDAKLNSCTVCSEKFDLEWHEEEEEWRFQNAIRYSECANEEDDTHPPTSRIFHPLCLKDHIIQQEKSAVADASQLSIDANTTIDSSQSIPALDNSDIKKEEPTEDEPKRKTESKKDNFVIPGFDSYIKEEEMETDETLNDDAKKMDDEILNALKQEIMDEDANDQDDAGDQSLAEESLVDEKPEEDLEIKVFEIEIPIDGSASAGLVIKDEAAAESSVDSSLSPVRHSDTGADQPSNNKPKQPIQPKRGGIVIKMKKPQPQPEPEEEPSETSEPVVQYTTEPGNVLDDVMMNECDDDHANNDDAHIEMMKLNDINDANDTNDNVNHDQTTAVIGHRPVDREGNTDDENLIEPHTTTDHLHQISSSIDNNSDNADSCIVDSNVTDSGNKGNNHRKDLSEVNDDVEQDASSVDDIRSSSASVDIVVAAAGEQAEYSAPCKNETAEEVVAKSQSASGCVIDRDDSVGHSDHSNCGDSRSRTIQPLSPSSSDQQSAISVIVNGVCGGGRSGAGGGFSDVYSDDSDDGFGNRPATTNSSDPSDYEKSGESPGGSSSRSSSGSVLSPKTPAATSEIPIPDSADCKSSPEQEEDQPPECNYYSRGHEMSSLCTIM